MNSPTKSCKSCFWASWTRTPSGKIKRHVAGDCTVKVQYPATPECQKQIIEVRGGIWPDQGTNCPTYCKK